MRIGSEEVDRGGSSEVRRLGLRREKRRNPPSKREESFVKVRLKGEIGFGFKIRWFVGAISMNLLRLFQFW